MCMEGYFEVHIGCRGVRGGVHEEYPPNVWKAAEVHEEIYLGVCRLCPPGERKQVMVCTGDITKP